MKRSQRDFTSLIDNLSRFLTVRGWSVQREKAGLRYYAPPPDLRLSNFSIALPLDATRPGIDTFVLAAVDAVSELYQSKLSGFYDELAANSELGESSTISVRFIDDATRRGTIPLPAMASFLESMEGSLFEAAKFKLGDSGPASLVAAERLTRETIFLQTEKGSFVARVEVPALVLRQAQLLPDAPPPLIAAEVCSSLFSAIDFLNVRILRSTEDYESEEAIAAALDLFDATLLEYLSKLLLSPDVTETEFGMIVGAQLRMTTTGPMLPEKTARLKDYVKFIRDHLHGDDGIDAQGAIVELRSRDPYGNRNHILILASYHGENTYLSATLNNDQYQLAVDAHRHKRAVRVQGRGLRLKTQVRITEIEIFEIASH